MTALPRHRNATVKLGILSDTHDQLARTRAAVTLLQQAGVEGLVHCGDLIESPILLACAVVPCWFVFGNNDADTVPALRQTAADCGAICLGWGGTFELAGRKLGVVHGHNKSDLNRVLADRPEILFSGHSHLRSEDVVDTACGRVGRINPGALHRAREFTVAVLDLGSDRLDWLSVPR